MLRDRQSTPVAAAPEGGPDYAGEAAFRALFEQSLDAIFLTATDGRVLAANPAACRMFGYTADELRTLGRAAVVDTADPRVAAALEERTRTGRFTGELTLRRKDGSSVPVEVTSQVFRDGDGRELTSLFVRDVTERARVGAHRALLDEASQIFASSRPCPEMLRALAGLLVPALCDWCVMDVLTPGGEGELVEVAAADPDVEARVREVLARWPHEASPERHPVGRVLHTGEPVLLAQVDEALLNESAAGPEHLALMRELRPGSSIVTPLVAHGRILGAMALSRRAGAPAYDRRDLELAAELGRRAGQAVEKARLHERMMQAVEAREQVLGYVAHDLRSPLAGIAIHAEFLLDHTVSDEQRRSSLSVIVAATRHLDRLIQDLLDVGSIEAGRLRVRARPEAVQPLVAHALQHLGARAARAGVALEVDVPAELGPVLADRARVVQVFSNLVANAIRHTPRAGRITVTARPEGADVLFSVADTGTGIEPADLARLFESFWQAPRKPTGGAGLGLAIARGIVEAHGGRIWAESVPQRGSIFFFTLPVADPAHAAEAEAALAEPVSAPAPWPQAAVRVLLVDDHSVVRRGLREVLGASDGRFTVVGEAATGEEGVRMAAELNPDAVVMDLHLPGIDGVEAIRRIRAAHENTRVLALTADAETGWLLKVLEAGGSGVVWKSAAHRDLVPALEAVAGGRLFLDAAGSRVLLRDVADATRGAPRDLAAVLSAQEREVAVLTAQGFTSREIGTRLHVSPKTVDAWRTNLMRKLGLEHRAELVRLVVRSGLLQGG